MANFKPDVKPEVLEWARESARLSREEAASKLSLSVLDLRMLEEGADDPTIGQLRRMVEVYKRPLAVFFLPKPPKTFDAMRDFRLASSNDGRPYSRALLSAFERVRMQREVVRELAELGDEVPPPFELTLSLDTNAELAGELIRGWLGTPAPEMPDAYRKHDLPIWISLAESRSILVTQVAGVSTAEMRGCSISDQPFPVIMLNGKDSPRGRVFTLMHELTHILLHAGGVCDLEERLALPRSDSEQTERYCNRVAAAALMSRALMLREPLVSSASLETRWTDEALKYLADRFGVSQEAMLLRLVGIGRASWEYYFARRHHFRKTYVLHQNQGGRLGYYRRKLRDFGHRYVTTVLDAYYREDITDSDLSDYLDIKLNKLSGLKTLLEPRQ